MSSKARHPVLWPRMKIRGKRRRRLAAERLETRYLIPHAHVTDQDDGSVTLGIGKPPPPAAAAAGYTIVVSNWHDGFGRPVKAPKPKPKPKLKVPTRKPGPFELSFTINTRQIDKAILDLAFGLSDGIKFDDLSRPDPIDARIRNTHYPIVDPRRALLGPASNA